MWVKILVCGFQVGIFLISQCLSLFFGLDFMHHGLSVKLFNVRQCNLPLFVNEGLLTSIGNRFKFESKSNVWISIADSQLAKYFHQLVVFFLTDTVSVNSEGAQIRSWIGNSVKCLQSSKIVGQHQLMTSFGKESNVRQSMEWETFAVNLKIVIRLVRSVNVVRSE